MSARYEEFEPQALDQQATQGALHAKAICAEASATKAYVFIEDDDDDMFDNMPV